jgi:hypothetical protein
MILEEFAYSKLSIQKRSSTQLFVILGKFSVSQLARILLLYFPAKVPKGLPAVQFCL